MTARELLDAYARGGKPLAGFSDWGTDPLPHEEFAPKAFAALRAVLDEHQPRWFDQYYRKTANAARAVQWQCPVDRESGTGAGYCATVRAIEEALS